MLQVTMSDTGTPADCASGTTITPPDQQPHTDLAPCHDVPAACAPHPASPQTPLAAESVGSPQSTGETLTKGTASEQTVQGPGDQSEPPAESQVMECDQPVSLEPEAAEEDVEVCNTSVSGRSKGLVWSLSLKSPGKRWIANSQANASLFDLNTVCARFCKQPPAFVSVYTLKCKCLFLANKKKIPNKTCVLAVTVCISVYFKVIFIACFWLFELILEASKYSVCV